MRNRHDAHDSLPSRLKHLVVELFRLDLVEPDTIADHAPLLGSLGLDSLDALELALCIEEEFNITIDNRQESERAFVSIASLAEYIQVRLNTVATAPRPVAPALPPQLQQQTSSSA